MSFLLVQNVFQKVIASQDDGANWKKTPNVIHLCSEAVPADDQANFKQGRLVQRMQVHVVLLLDYKHVNIPLPQTMLEQNVD